MENIVKIKEALELAKKLIDTANDEDWKTINDAITSCENVINKNCNKPAVSVVREPEGSGAVCPHFETCLNGGKNEYCDLQTFKEIDCFVGQNER